MSLVSALARALEGPEESPAPPKEEEVRIPPSTSATPSVDRPYKYRMRRKRFIRRSKLHSKYVENTMRIAAMRSGAKKKRWE